MDTQFERKLYGRITHAFMIENISFDGLIPRDHVWYARGVHAVRTSLVEATPVNMHACVVVK
jgi:hypothetical protein